MNDMDPKMPDPVQPQQEPFRWLMTWADGSETYYPASWTPPRVMPHPDCKLTPLYARPLTTERGNRFCKHDDCPYPDCLVEGGVCPSQPPATTPTPFYGAQCPSYPACNGGCGLGCTHEIERSRTAAQPSGKRKFLKEALQQYWFWDEQPLLMEDLLDDIERVYTPSISSTQSECPLCSGFSAPCGNTNCPQLLSFP